MTTEAKRRDPSSTVEPDTGAGHRHRPRRRWAVAAMVAVVAAVAFVLFWFQPQKLIIDDEVREPAPTVAPTSDPTTAPTVVPGAGGIATPTTPAPPPAGPVELARGDFVSLDHGTRGVAVILELPDGQRIVRLEGLDTSNGPDLYVYLTANPAAGPESAFDDDYVSLGRLKGNQGDQNYDVPAGADIERFPTVLIWCDRFNSAFGAADLAPA